MDRRMYRGTMGNNYGRTVSPYRAPEPVCGHVTGGCPAEERCEKERCERDCYEGDFDRFPIAMCYVPWQCFRDLYENEFVALEKGTIFKELDLGWYGRGCK